MTRVEELERRIKHWQIYGEEPDLMTAKLVNDMKYACLRLHLDHQQTRQDLREFLKAKNESHKTNHRGLPCPYALRLLKKYGWEE